MLNIEAFRELCRRAVSETDPTALQRIKDALRLMLRVEQLEWCDFNLSRLGYRNSNAKTCSKLTRFLFSLSSILAQCRTPAFPFLAQPAAPLPESAVC